MTGRFIEIVLICGTLSTSEAQSFPPLSRHAAGIAQAVSSLSPQEHISVISQDGSESFGDYTSHDDQSFTFFDVDHKVPVTVRYEAVKKVRRGYGGYNSVQQRHVDRRREWIIVAVVVGVLGAVIGAAAAAR